MPALNCVVKTSLCAECNSKLLASYQSSQSAWQNIVSAVQYIVVSPYILVVMQTA